MAGGLRRCPSRRRGGSNRATGGDRSVEASERFGDTQDALAVDELPLSSCGLAERGGGEAIDLTQGALRQLVQGGERIVGEQGAVGAGSREAEADVLGSVIDGGRGDEEAVVDAGEQRAMGPAR